MKDQNSFRDMAPDVYPRTCGGFLVVTPKNEPVRIGVTGPTEEEAVASYWQRIRVWQELLEPDDGAAKNNG